ncbi:hypothetical protein AA101099_2183 [Neoasaia chiangmaiensis NBRC 101099]|uniref:Probable membrane transporter protein n=1 Tax=Neoasaia chiangmaiensis TaxID=320497 RepID=A0A1U9KSW4_9PROT|nr:sulfite exporter TauE/SafE family protein [Neoasaia chiangmaiensis]AQS88852.1 hypothetical protein A0U93_14010 [Neoasaia chiangmaiensis]GBR40586.1 hypothetical protein AA101099_2183 [Neoasaia chiangmaiensis NBRC 101099]GEN13829.1 UPF0721 transmembrane protein [Neoasaia chiangmaiensis]
MPFIDDIQPLYALSGLAVGFLVGMTGVGGGSLMTPLLILLFRIHPQTAVGTDLLYAAITKSVGTIVHGRRGVVDWRVVLRLSSGSIPATLLSLLVLQHYGSPSHDASHIITVSLGIALLLTAPSVFFRHQLQQWSHRKAGSVSERATGLLTVALGFALGVMVTFSSVGAGAIGVTILILLYPRLPTASIVGSDIAHAVPLTLIAGMGHWWLGSVHGQMLASLLCGSIPGIILGSLCVGLVHERVQRSLLAAVLFIVGARMI